MLGKLGLLAFISPRLGCPLPDTYHSRLWTGLPLFVAEGRVRKRMSKWNTLLSFPYGGTLYPTLVYNSPYIVPISSLL